MALAYTAKDFSAGVRGSRSRPGSVRPRRAQRLADDPAPAAPGLPGYHLAFCGYLIGAALGAAGAVAEALAGLAPLLPVLFGFFASLAYLARELGLLLVAIAVLRYRVLPPPWGAPARHLPARRPPGRARPDRLPGGDGTAAGADRRGPGVPRLGRAGGVRRPRLVDVGLGTLLGGRRELRRTEPGEKSG